MLTVRCEERLATVKRFATEIGLAAQLDEKLEWLSNFGNIGLPPDAPGRIEHRATLFADFAPHSFTFRIEKPDGAGGWRDVISGGLIYEGADCPADGSFPSLTVSVGAPRRGWFPHT